ncbi:periaxin isoform X1 [Gopherus evgoodei]|uniref:periaxin isoform X1 n=1 Tax=Gopherus evgoodei TaxID=1825980 RepID=UPI0011CF69DB|nr:periaxin isoform X1 [Gopherus evgoodei]XP_030402562.1 periaxin isoform X1 [Gopherus evgoodei]
METQTRMMELLAGSLPRQEAAKMSELVEIILETEARAGASGISVAGGGKEGLFVSHVLRESPAAKALSLKEGDQLLSARVYFENVRYEDALRMLKCAEPYKVSFCLKRTVPRSDVPRSPTAGGLEVKGPQAKLAKLSIKSLAPTRKQKGKGLAKAPEEEVALTGSVEPSAGKLDVAPVDVEFSLPKFAKLRKAKSATEAGAAGPSPDISVELSSSHIKGRRLKFPRLKVKEAAGAQVLAVTGTLEAARPKGSVEGEAGVQGKAPQFAAPCPKVKKPKEDAGLVEVELKDQVKFKAPQVELDIPIPDLKAPKVAAGVETPEISGREEALQLKLPKFGVSAGPPEGEMEVERLEGNLKVPKVGIFLPMADREAEGPEEELRAGIKLPLVEIAAPKVEVDLSLPKVEGALEPPDVSAKGEGLKIEMPKFGISAGEVEGTLKTPAIPAPKLGTSLPSDKGDAEGAAGRYKAGMKLPSLNIGVRQVDVEIPLPRGKADTEWEVELPDVTVKIPKISLPPHGGRAKEEEVERELKVPQVEVKVGKAEGESPELKAKGPKIKMPSFGISLREHKPDADTKAKEPAAEGKMKFPVVKMPSIDISVPKAADVQLPKTKMEPAGLAGEGRVKAPDGDGAEGPEFKFKMPQVSLPKFDLSGMAGKAESKAHVPSPKAPQLEADTGGLEIVAGKISVPTLGISVRGIKPVDVELSEASMRKPKLEIAVEKPKIEVRLPSGKADGRRLESEVETAQARLSFPSVKMPSLDIDMPKVGVDLDLPKAEPGFEGELRAVADLKERNLQLQKPQEPLPNFGAVCKDLEVEIDVPVPKAKADRPTPRAEVELQGAAFEGPDLSGMVAKIPKVDISFGKEKLEAEELDRAGLEGKGKADTKFPKVGLELKSPEVKPGILEATVKLPSVEISTPKLPDVAIEVPLGGTAAVDISGKLPETDTKLKSPKFSFPKFGISGPKVKKGGLEAVALQAELEAETLEASTKGPKLKMPKFGLSFSRSKQGADLDGPRLSAEGEGKAPKAKVEISGPHVDMDSPEAKMKLPSVKLPTVDISSPRVDVDIDLPKGKGDVSDQGVTQAGEISPNISMEVPDIKLKMPKFSLPKFGGQDREKQLELEQETLKGEVKGSVEALSGELDGKSKGKEAKMKMPRFKMPSFGIARKDVEVSGPSVTAPEIDVKGKKGKAAAKEPDVAAGSPKEKLKGPFMKMPKLTISSPKADLKVEADMRGSKDESYIQGPDIEIKMPQVELPKFGAKEERANMEMSERPESPGTKLKVGTVKMPSLDISVPDQVPSLQISVPGVRAEGEPLVRKPVMDVSEADIKGYEGNLKIPKAPSIDISAPKLDLDISLPKASVEMLGQHEPGLKIEGDAAFKKADTKIKMPKVELPKYGLEGFLGKDLDREISGAEAEMHLLKGQKLKGPSIKDQKITLEMEGGKYAADATEASLLGSKIRVPKLDISLPKARLSDVEVPLTEGEITIKGLEEAEGKFKLPSVGLPKFSTPKVKAPEVGFDVGLSRDQDFALDTSGLHGKVPKVEVSGPKIKLPKSGGASSDDQWEADINSSKTPKVELKPPKFQGSLETPGSEVGVKEAKLKMPSVPIGFTVGKGEGESSPRTKDSETEGYDSKFKLKMPSFGISKVGTEAKGDESRMDTQPLCPTAEGTDFFKMPQLAIPDVGFSAGPREAPALEGGKAEMGGDTRVSVEKLAGAEDLEQDVGGLEVRLKMPKIKMSPFGISGSKGDEGNMTASLHSHKGSDSEQRGGKKSLLKMPDLELSAPSIKAHAEYEVEGAQLHHSGSTELPRTGATGIQGEDRSVKAPGGKGDTSEAEAGKKYKMKLPKFGIVLPKAIQEGGEGHLSRGESKAQEAETKVKMAKVKKAVFVLVKPKGKGAEATSGLLEGDGEATAGSLERDGDGKAKVPKIKLKPSFGLSLSKPKAGVEVNGELEPSAKEEGDLEKGSKLKLPKLGFSKTEVTDLGTSGKGSASQLNGEEGELSLQNGSQDSKAKLAKIKLPQVEFSSPYKAAEMDPEMNLKLVRAEEAKDEAHISTFMALKAAKLKSPKITFSGFKKKEGEHAGNVVSSAARTEMALLEKGERDQDAKPETSKVSLGFTSKSKGEYNVERGELDGREKSPKFKFPKLAFSPKIRGVLEVTSEQQERGGSSQGEGEKGPGALEGFKIRTPKLGFSTQLEEQIPEEGGGQVKPIKGEVMVGKSSPI